MNKKIFGGIAIVIIAAAVALNVSMSNQKQDAASMLALANVEALAEGEEFTITCDQYEGRCWAIDYISPILVCHCYFSGYQKDICYKG
jgi:hypothetical protein